MKLDFQVMEALELLERERGVPVDTILDALANGLVSAYKRAPGAAEEARVVIDPDAGDIIVYAQELDEDGNVVREWEDTPDDFGRIAAQTAKQVIAQRLRDAKREQVFGIYEGREGDLITGIVQQVDHRYSILDLGDAEALMPGSERIPYERLDRGNRVKALILEVRGDAKGPQIVVSRSHPDFVRRLLELEVPELLDGTIEIKAIAREPGHRTKIAVSSNDPNVDPKGACVGARGSRVRQVVNELRTEKVDVVQWREDTAQFIAEALGPAKVKEVRINEDEKEAIVIVNDHQLSLAIGREGQNARLAARLSGYRVDIRSESQERGEIEGEEPQLGGDQPSPLASPDQAVDPAEAIEPAAEAIEVADVVPGEAEIPDVEVVDEEAGEVEQPAAPVGEVGTEGADGDVEPVPSGVTEAETEAESEPDEGSEQA
ncbi:MAG: transcription termination factor NusA [Acidimicrobiia bacterium]|nr:transcription termination factor NusA [Acidimicrobiia bacterium]MDH5615485.1 transcription termination factor NusA [Acidimicrobiia bacterium]